MGHANILAVSRRTILGALLLAAATLGLYSRVLHQPFVSYDDPDYVTANSHVQAGLVWTTFTWALTATAAENWHPLTWLSHAFDWQLYGSDAAGHHLTSVILHTINAVLIFLLLLRATGAFWRSLIVAGLFALHPLNVESVAWVAERKNVLSTLFFLLALSAYGWYAIKPDVKRYLLVALLFALGLTAKPMVITLPFVLLLLDYWPLKRVGGQRVANGTERKKRKKSVVHPPVSQSTLGRLVLEKLPLLALCAGSAVLTIIAQRSGGTVRSLHTFPLLVRVENAVISYATYIFKTLLPVHLAAFYPYPRRGFVAWRLGLSLLCIAVSSALTWRERNAHAYLVTGWLWFLGTLVPVIGLVQVGDQAIADRYMYLPGIGLFVMVVWGGTDIANSLGLDFRWKATLATAALVTLSLLSWRQSGYWRSDYDLWTHAAQVTEGNIAAEEGISKALLAQGRGEEALPGLEDAAKVNAEDPVRHANLATALYEAGRLAEAIGEFKAAANLAADPVIRSRCYESLAALYADAGDYSSVRASYEEALKANPQAGGGMVQRLSGVASAEKSGSRYLQLALLLQEVGKANEADNAFRMATGLDPHLGSTIQALQVPSR